MTYHTIAVSLWDSIKGYFEQTTLSIVYPLHLLQVAFR